MDLDGIKEIIARDENRVLELKKTTGELKDGMHTACAFLNTEGGWLFFGIAPTSLKILGQQVTDSTQREIAQALSYMEPQVDVRVEYIDVPDHPGHQVIAMHFDGCPRHAGAAAPDTRTRRCPAHSSSYRSLHLESSSCRQCSH